MANRLRFVLKLQDNPYAEDAVTRLEAWGSISIVLLADENQMKLFEWQWDLALIAEWFAEHRRALCHGDLLIGGGDLSTQPSESLAQALNRLHRQEFANGEEEYRWAEALYEYYQQHGLPFALRGGRVPAIIIGCNHGVGEISLSNESQEWAYQFDMADFCEHLQHSLGRIVSDWLARMGEVVAARAQVILDRLDTEE